MAQFDGDRMTLHPMRQQPTIHDLLRHTAGLTYAFLDDGPMQRMYVKARLRGGTFDTDGFIHALAGLPLAFQPGSTWEYSHATDVLGAVIEAVTGRAIAYTEAPLPDAGMWGCIRDRSGRCSGMALGWCSR